MDDVIPLNFLQHLNTSHIYYNNRYLTHSLQKYEAKQQAQGVTKPVEEAPQKLQMSLGITWQKYQKYPKFIGNKPKVDTFIERLKTETVQSILRVPLESIEKMKK